MEWILFALALPFILAFVPKRKGRRYYRRRAARRTRGRYS